MTLVVQPDGKAAGYLHDLAAGTSKQLFTRTAGASDVYAADKEVSALYVLSRGRITRYDLSNGNGKPVAFEAEVTRDVRDELEAIFDHSWRTTTNTFYRPDMQGKDWQAVGDHYRRFVAHLTHWEDLTELLSEMQGELDASHQGSSYHSSTANGDDTARLGLHYDRDYNGEGARVAAVIPGGPADRGDSELKPGSTVLAVDGVAIGADMSIDRLLNRRTGQPVALTIQGQGGGNLHDQLITMLTGRSDSNLVSRDGHLIVANPIGRFTRPSALLVNASSYSDASVFPTLYQVKKIGPVIGERVPGTGTAVSTVAEIESGIHYTVPELGFRLTDGRYFENMEVVPDVLVHNDPESVAQGRDLQLEKAVEQLLSVLPGA